MDLRLSYAQQVESHAEATEQLYSEMKQTFLSVVLKNLVMCVQLLKTVLTKLVLTSM